MINTTPRNLDEPKQIVILGSGFAGIEVLKRLQKAFNKDKTVKIILVSKDNFLLFTPMLPEVCTGMIETRHIITPVRAFCNKATFYESEVKSIDLVNRKLLLKYSIGKQSVILQRGREYLNMIISLSP
jgi:NADH dehydrogenase